VEANLRVLEGTLAEAQAKKAAAEDEALRCSQRLAMANRLVNGLSSENDRWKIEVGKLRETETMLIGDVLLASAFVSYIGAFNNIFRRRLWLVRARRGARGVRASHHLRPAPYCQDTWAPDIRRCASPCPRPSTPCSCSRTRGTPPRCFSEGLPADRICHRERVHHQRVQALAAHHRPAAAGHQWLRRKEEPNGLKVVQLTQGNWLKILITAITQGLPLLIENVADDLDATLEPRARACGVQQGEANKRRQPRARPTAPHARRALTPRPLARGRTMYLRVARPGGGVRCATPGADRFTLLRQRHVPL